MLLLIMFIVFSFNWNDFSYPINFTIGETLETVLGCNNVTCVKLKK